MTKGISLNNDRLSPDKERIAISDTKYRKIICIHKNEEKLQKFNRIHPLKPIYLDVCTRNWDYKPLIKETAYGYIKEEFAKYEEIGQLMLEI